MYLPPILTTIEEDLNDLGLSNDTDDGAASIEEASKRQKYIPVRGRKKALKRARRRKAKLKRKRQRKIREKKPLWKSMKKRHEHDIKLKKGGDPDRPNPKRTKYLSKRTYRSTVQKKEENMSNSGLDRVSNLLEEVQGLVESTTVCQYEEAIEAFAHMALMAEMLAEGLVSLAEQHEDDDLAEAAETFLNLSEDAAAIALYLDENEEVGANDLQETFQDQVSYLLDGLELFSDLTEEEEEEEEEDEKEDEKEDEEEKEESFDWAAVNASLADRLSIVEQAVATHLKPKSSLLDKVKNKMGFGPGAKGDKAQHPEADDEHPAEKPDLLGKVSTKELVLKKTAR